MIRKLKLLTILLTLGSVFFIVASDQAAARVVAKTSNSISLYEGSSKSFSGVVISLHGGGWVGNRDPRRVAIHMAPFVRPALNESWMVVHLAYSTSVARALTDINRLVRQMRRKYPGKPLCLLGNSAGAHLALTYAGLKNMIKPKCVIANGAVTDVPAFMNAIKRKSAVHRHNLGRFLRIGFKSRLQIQRYSPIYNLRYFNSQLALFVSRRDPIVPFTHSLNFSFKLLSARPALYNRVKVLSPGTLPFVHSTISAASWIAYANGVTAILRRQAN